MKRWFIIFSMAIAAMLFITNTSDAVDMKLLTKLMKTCNFTGLEDMEGYYSFYAQKNGEKHEVVMFESINNGYEFTFIGVNSNVKFNPRFSAEDKRTACDIIAKYLPDWLIATNVNGYILISTKSPGLITDISAKIFGMTVNAMVEFADDIHTDMADAIKPTGSGRFGFIGENKNDEFLMKIKDKAARFNIKMPEIMLK